MSMARPRLSSSRRKRGLAARDARFEQRDGAARALVRGVRGAQAGRRDRQRQQPVLLLDRQMQRLLARRQDVDAAGAHQRRRGQVGDGGKQVLTVVEDEQ
jgi:hypothetical protein